MSTWMRFAVTTDRSVCRLPQGIAALTVILLVGGCSEPQAGDRSGQRTFVELLGIDTVAVESYTRTADGFEGEALVRSPVTRVVRYGASLGPDGMVRQLNVEWRMPDENPEGPEPNSFTVTIDGDSATVIERQDSDVGARTLAVPPGVVPTAGKTPMLVAVMEQAIRQAIAVGGDSVPVHFLAANRWQAIPNAVVRLSSDTVAVDFFGSPILVHIDEEGRVLSRSGERTTMKVVSQPVDGSVDVQALAAAFAERDARGAGMGVASPRAIVETSLGGANLRIVYSRPAKRGRDIWGGLVPWNRVWRTGANAATEFSTDRDLTIGGVEVPAGTYTLYSIFAPDMAKLIINQQTGQWGTVYDASQDLARVDLERESLTDPVERFTMDIEPSDAGGRLVLAWDTIRFSVPITVK